MEFRVLLPPTNALKHTYLRELKIDEAKYKFGIIFRKTSHLGLNLLAPKAAANIRTDVSESHLL